MQYDTQTCDHWRDGNDCRYCGADLGPREGRLPLHLPQQLDGDELVTYRPKWAGAYSVALAYGGREEGGWWYEVAEPLGSALVRDGDDPMVVARELWEAFRDQDDGRELHDSLASSAVRVFWEQRPGEHASVERPRYE